MSMRNAFLFTVLVSVCAVQRDAFSQIVINEFSYDDSGEDDQEFVELFNAGSEPVDLLGWTIETGTDAGPGPEILIPLDSPIEAGSYVVIGNETVPNVRVIPVGSDFFGNGPGYLLLRDAGGEPVDGVAYETNKGEGTMPDEAVGEGGIWGNHVLVASSRMSWQRWMDGRDTDHAGADFGQLPWTPGASNDRENSPDFEGDFDDGEIDQAIDAFAGSFVPARIIDPVVVSEANPNVIPESPDGGFAMVVWDPAGGGNFVTLDAAPVADMVFEAWVWFDADPRPIDELETWSIGVRGTSGTFYNTPILFESNGNSGITWTYQVTSEGATLYLVDENFSGPSIEREILGSVDVTPGENDGWQRLRLEVNGDEAVGRFGGTYGSTEDGDEIAGTLREEGVGAFYIAYREARNDDLASRPPTLDSLRVGRSGDLPPPGTLFRRGDANADGQVNLSDPVGLLNHLFAGAAGPSCAKAADADDDGAMTITDAISVLTFLFSGGAEPKAPFAECGADPTVDPLDCASFPPCG